MRKIFLVLLSAVLVLSLVGMVSADTLLTNNTLFYQLNEGSGSTIYDSSPSGNNGTTSNSPAWVFANSQFGFTGSSQTYSLNFTRNLNQQVTSNGLTGISGSSDRTLTAWVYLPNVPISSNTEYGILSLGKRNGGSTYELRYGANSTNTHYDLGIDGSTFTSQQPVSIYGPYFLAVTQIGNNITLWWGQSGGGIQVYLSTLYTSSTTNWYLQMGCQSDGTSCWSGSLQDVGLWNVGLNNTELNQLYNNGNPYDPYLVPTAPSVSLSYPANYTFNTSTGMFFNSSATAGQLSGLKNATIYTNIGGTWRANQTYLFTGSPASGTANFTLNNIGSGQFIWNVLYVNNKSLSAWAPANFTLGLGSTPPSLTVTSPGGLYSYLINGNNLSLNYSVVTNDGPLSSCWYVYNGITTYLPCGSNQVANITMVGNSTSLTLYSNDSSNNRNSLYQNWSYNIFQNSISYNALASEGSSQTFMTNLSYNPIYSIFGILNYAGTNYSSTLTTDAAGNSIFSNTITIPGVNASSQVNNFTNIFALTNLANTYYLTSPQYQQTVSQIPIDNCGTYTNVILNMSMYDQDNQTVIPNGTIQTIANVYSADGSILLATFNNSVQGTTSTTSKVCLQAGFLNVSNYSLNYEIRFYAPGYWTQLLYGQNISIGNTTLANPTLANLLLYDLVSTEGQLYTVTFRDNNFNIITNAVANVKRQYFSTNQYLLTEAPLTDQNGQVTLHLIPGSTVYNIVLTLNNQPILTYNAPVTSCTSTPCTLSLNAPQSTTFIGDVLQESGISGGFYNSSNNTINFYYSSLNGNPLPISWSVILNDGYGNSTICSQNVLSTSYTFACPIPTVYQNSSVVAYVYNNGQQVAYYITSFAPVGGIGLLGGTAVILGILMYTTLTLLFISNPTAMVIGAVLGMVFASLFYLLNGGSIIGYGSILIWFIIMAFIIIWQKKESQ